MDNYQSYIHKSRYARWLEDKGRRETWDETVDRYINFFKDIHADNDFMRQAFEELRKGIYETDVMPSMRCLMTAGPALERDNVAAFNCAYMPIDNSRSLDELMYILLCGTGDGFSVEKHLVHKLPEVAEEFYETDTTIVVPDSKIGWTKSFRELINLLYAGQVPKWDTSRVRSAGSRLKTFGGRSSGPAPLEHLFEFTVELFRRSAGRRLTTLECHDLVCTVASIVVVGGVRRAALIGLSSPDDRSIAECKSIYDVDEYALVSEDEETWTYTITMKKHPSVRPTYRIVLKKEEHAFDKTELEINKKVGWWIIEPQRALANNSVCHEERPSFDEFLNEWKVLYDSKSGERGLFNRRASQNIAARNGRRDHTREFGTNPCLHPDSLIETVNGRVKIKDITEPTSVYTMDENGKLVIRRASASWVSKKDAPLLNITVASGKVVRCTPDHKIFIEGKGWVEAQDISIGDRVVHLVRNRRGASYSGVKLTTEGKRAYRMEHRLVWEGVNGPIPEGYDIHHIDGDTYNNDIDNLECLSHSDHASLTRYESANDHQVLGYRDACPGRHGSMWGFISSEPRKQKKIVPMPEELKSNLHQFATVVKIEDGGTSDVYDMTVGDTHNFIADFVVVHNCSEIILRPYQFCNLTEVVVRPTDSFEELSRKVRLAVRLGTLQATLTNFRYLRKIWRTNTEEEALLGVSFTGIYDHPILSGVQTKGSWFDHPKGVNDLDDILSRLRDIAIEENALWAKRLDINPAAAITCVKPSGTVSQLVDSASGIHARFAPYYIRRVRGDIKDPLTIAMKEAGYPYEEDVLNPQNLVFSFPQKAPKGSKTTEDLNAISQLDLWKKYQDSWCEHKPSITVYYKDGEFLEAGAWLWENFDEVSGISFLPRTDHSYKQAPYEEITESEYKEMVKSMETLKPIESLELNESEDNTSGSQTLACVGSSCEL